MLKKLLIILAVVVLTVLAVAAVKNTSNESHEPSQPILDTKASEGYMFDIGGETYSLVNGCDAYKKEGENWNLVDQICSDPNYRSRYSERDGTRFFRLDDGREMAILPQFHFDVESAATIQDIFANDIGEVGWTGVTLQSPKAKTVEEYVALQNCLRVGTCDFRDNRVESTTELSHGGKKSLKFYSVSPNQSIDQTKASLDTSVIQFTEGDDAWFSAWFFFKEGRPTAIMDMESRWLKGGLGPRLWLNEDGTLEVELKALHKPRYKQAGTGTAVPTGKWVTITAHFRLSHKSDGITEVWQDGKKIIDARGMTVPFPDTILDSMEVGVTSLMYKGDVVFYMDDIYFGRVPPLHL